MKIFTESRIKLKEIVTDVQTYLTEKYGQSRKVFTPASPFGQLLAVVSNISQLIMYYIEYSITELNLRTAATDTSILGLASLVGHNPSTSVSATGKANLRYNGKTLSDETASSIIILNKTKIYCPFNNLPYLIYTSEAEIRVGVSSTVVDIPVKIVQGELNEITFTADGTSVQTFRINEGNPEYIDRNLLEVYVNNTKCELYDSLYDIPLGKLGCVVKLDVGNGLAIIFGSQYAGFIPPSGSIVKVNYVKNAGVFGNLLNAQNLKFNFTESGYDNYGNEIDLNEYFSILLQDSVTFGSNPESINLTRLLAPKTSRSYVLANTQSYEYYFRKMNYFSVVDVYNTFEDGNINDDNVVYAFLIPNLQFRISPNQNYFTAPMENFTLSAEERSNLITKVEESGQMMIGTQLNIINPFVKRFVMFVVVNYLKGYSRELIREDIINKISYYLINYTRRDRIPRSDFIAILENVQGIDSVNVYFKEDPANNNTLNNQSKIDALGDIIIGKEDYCVVRGGWVDPDTNTSYVDTLSDKAQSSLNIIFNEEVDPTLNRRLNKSLVDNTRYK